jgi:hypothetical protein
MCFYHLKQFKELKNSKKIFRGRGIQIEEVSIIFSLEGVINRGVGKRVLVTEDLRYYGILNLIELNFVVLKLYLMHFCSINIK